MMRIRMTIFAGAALALTLTGCAGLFGSSRPDEFAVARNTPLVIPPDFALVPPTPGDPQPQGVDARNQAIEALFGGPAPRSASERQLLSDAGRDRAAAGARSVAGDPDTEVVDKGATTRAIIAAPEGQGEEASVSTPE